MDLLTRLVKEAVQLPQMNGYMAIDRQALISDLKAATPIRIQNVADYLFLETDQESFHLSQDFPNVAPPWPIFFMSYRMPARPRRHALSRFSAAAELHNSGTQGRIERCLAGLRQCSSRGPIPGRRADRREFRRH
jgi:hypothetical protein